MTRGGASGGDERAEEAARRCGPAPARVGAFVVREAIAAGSFGAVYRAEHADSGAAAAVKIMHAELAASAEAAARFTLEIAAMQRSLHPNVLVVLDSGRLADGRLYLVTELLHGESLEARLARGGPLAADEVREILRGVCGALAAAHARGVVHRDVKASNVFLAEAEDASARPFRAEPSRRRVVLLDFGVAKLQGGGAALTATGELIGTLSCMAPEQILGRPVDPRTDVYALGVLAFRMLTGVPVFAARHPIALQQMHLYTRPRAPGAVVPVDPRCDEAVLRALAKEPERRQSGAEVFLAELIAGLGG